MKLLVITVLIGIYASADGFFLKSIFKKHFNVLPSILSLPQKRFPFSLASPPKQHYNIIYLNTPQVEYHQPVEHHEIIETHPSLPTLEPEDFNGKPDTPPPTTGYEYPEPEQPHPEYGVPVVGPTNGNSSVDGNGHGLAETQSNGTVGLETDINGGSGGLEISAGGDGGISITGGGSLGGGIAGAVDGALGGIGGGGVDIGGGIGEGAGDIGGGAGGIGGGAGGIGLGNNIDLGFGSANRGGYVPTVNVFPPRLPVGVIRFPSANAPVPIQSGTYLAYGPAQQFPISEVVAPNIQKTPIELPSIHYLPVDGSIAHQNDNTAPNYRVDPNQYSHSYVTGDGIRVSEAGHTKISPQGDEITIKSGSYDYRTDDGSTKQVDWVADENGFRIVN